MTQLGDRVDKLPVNDHAARPGELEFMYNLFQPKNKQLITSTVGVFSRPLMAALIFAILSMPFFMSTATKITKNALYGRILLIVVYFFIFLIADKYWLK